DERALLYALLVVLDLPGPDLEAAPAELVQPADALDRRLAGPALGLQLVDAVERRMRDHQPGAELLVLLLGAALDDAEVADQPRQRQPLPHHRDEDQGERDELDQLAAGQRRTRVGVQRQRQRRRQRHRAPHPRPAPDHAGLPAAAARDLRRPAVDRPYEERDDEVPDEAGRDHGRTDGGRVADHLAGRNAGKPADDHGQLQADQDEQ